MALTCSARNHVWNNLQTTLQKLWTRPARPNPCTRPTPPLETTMARSMRPSECKEQDRLQRKNWASKRIFASTHVAGLNW